MTAASVGRPGRRARAGGPRRHGDPARSRWASVGTSSRSPVRSRPTESTCTWSRAAAPRTTSPRSARRARSWSHRPPSESRPARLAWEQTGLPRLVRAVRGDVLHSPHYTMPLGPMPAARVVTLHDATFFSDPDVHSRVKRATFRAAIRIAVRRAGRPRRAVARDARRGPAVRRRRPDRFHVAYHGVDAAMFRRTERGRAGAGRPVARAWRRGGTSRSWARSSRARTCRHSSAPGRRRSAGRERPPALVLAGGKGWDHAVDPAVAEVPDTLRVLRPGLPPAGRPRRLPAPGRRSSRTRAWARASGCPCSRPWRAVPRSSRRASCRCPRSAGTRSRTAGRRRTRSRTR